jgi:hypothetical protein
MSIRKKHRSIIENGDLSDLYTRDYIRSTVIPAIELEIKDLEGINDACEQRGLGRMMAEEEKEAMEVLETARNRLTAMD